MLDFACGSGSLLLNVRKRMGPHGIGKIYGQEKNITTYNLARMNMLLHGVKDTEFEIYHGDTLANDWDILCELNPARKPSFDAIVANPPFSLRWEPTEAMDERIAAVHRALLRWLETQDRRATLEGGHRGLIRNPTLRHRRAPGNTCLSALQEATRPGEPARNDSKGCGTIMRVAPVAFLAEASEIRELAMRTSALTHGHPTGGWAAAFWAELIRRVCDHPEGRGAFDPIVQDLRAEYGSIPGAEEVALAARRALSSDACQPEDMEGLGGGWTAETALAIALRACRCARSLEHGLKLAVMHGGDSDSTGAIAGNLLGVMFPEEVFRHPWNADVEGAEILDDLLPPSRT